ncbi:MAG: SCO family protein [Polyangiales bacterium]
MRQLPGFVKAMILAAALFAAVGAYAALRRARKIDLPVIAAVPAFAMNDQQGKVVTTDSLRGRVFIADFFFLSCPTSCPKLTARMKQLHDRIAQKNLTVQLVSISVDPENDTSDKLALKAKELGSQDRIWTFLTGKSEDLERVVVKGFKIHVEDQRKKADSNANIYTIMHGDWFVLVDAQGRIRGYYDTDEEGKLDAVLRDAELLARYPGT